MKKAIAVVTVLALAFTTGFTCSKQTPDAANVTTPPPAELPVPTQEQMAAPAPGAAPTQTEVPAPGSQPAAPATPPPAVPAPGAGH